MSNARAAAPNPESSFERQVASRFGLLPNFFRTARAAPGLIEKLWSFAENAYLDNPLPSLFKERLFVYLSRFCEVRYCIVRHCGFLVGLGRPAGDASVLPHTLQQAITLLKHPIPSTAELQAAIGRLENQLAGCGVPAPETQAEWDLLKVLAVQFLEPLRSSRARFAARQYMGEAEFEYATALLAFVHAAHFWTETHPELAYEQDMVFLMEAHPEFARLLLNEAEAEDANSKQQLKRALLQIREAENVKADLRNALDTSESRLTAIFAHAGVGLSELSLDGRFLDVNGEFCRIVGRSRDELLKLGLADVTAPEDLPRTLETVERVIETGTTAAFDNRYVRPTGLPVWANTTVTLLRDGQADRDALLVSAADLTARKAAEQALRASEERFRALVTANSASLYRMSPDWTEMRELHGEGFLSSTESPNTAWLEKYIDRDDRETVNAAIHAAIREKKLFELEHRVRRLDGSLGWTFSRAVPLLNESGEIVEWFGAARDITEEKQAEEHLRETQKLESLGILAGGIAHDFNNLLTGMLGNASLLAETLKDSTQQRLALLLIEASERMARLTKQMLAYAGKGRFIIEPVSLSHEVTRIATLIHASIPKHVALHLSLANDLPMIEGDASQIQQVIMNLVVNGAEAIAPGGGTVEVSTSVEKVSDGNLLGNLFSGNVLPGLYAALTVSDTGCGMDQETKSKIFDPFFSTKFTGRGLGLSAVLGIVRGHKGLLTVESALGRGSTFKVLFPIGAEARPSDTAETILVVDDEEVVLQVAETALRTAGYDVLTTANGQQAVDVFRARHREIHLVILDLTMPVLAGPETLLLIREIDPDVPVIGSSGYNETNAAAHFGSGVVDFLQKPYRGDVLRHKVSRILQQRTAETKHRGS